MELQNSKIRKIILAEHDVLRGQLVEIEAKLDLYVDGDGPGQAAIQAQLRSLLETFLRHIEHEERILRPVLKDVDAWGPERIAEMDREHTEQRKLVAHLAGPFSSAPPVTWAAEVRSFIVLLRADMAHEEADCLDPRLLRDDVIVIDSFGG